MGIQTENFDIKNKDYYTRINIAKQRIKNIHNACRQKGMILTHQEEEYQINDVAELFNVGTTALRKALELHKDRIKHDDKYAARMGITLVKGEEE